MHARVARHRVDLGPPDVGFRLAVGAYVAAIVSGLGTVFGVAVGASIGVLVASYPIALNVGLVLGGALLGRITGLPERIGRSRRLMAACWLPPIAFVAASALGLVAPSLATFGFAFAALFSAVCAAVPALFVAWMARTRYVTAVTPDDPAVSWTWVDPRESAYRTVFALATIAFALWYVYAGNAVIGLLWLCYGAFWLITDATDVVSPSDRSGELRIHEAGLVKERQYRTGLVPWDRVTGVELTDDELVIERRWLDVRCRRSAIDDAESVRRAIDRARRIT